MAKMIALFEELRLDLPNVRNRLDSKVPELKRAMNSEQVLAALDDPWADNHQQSKANTLMVDLDGKILGGTPV